MNESKKFISYVAFFSAILLGLSACTTTEEKRESGRTTPHYGTVRLAEKIAREEAEARKKAEETNERLKVYKGTGTVVKPPARSAAEIQASGDAVGLQFEGVDLREVVKNILGDILQESYILDPSVQGAVTLRTSKPVPRNALIPTLETLLRQSGFGLVKEAGLYKVMPAANIVRGSMTPQLGGANQPIPMGFSVILVPLKYVGVKEMLRILEPFTKDGTSVRMDELRNLLILSGTERELRHLVDTVDMFDVDWMAGMSVGFFTLQSDVKAVHKEYEQIVGGAQLNPLAGLIRVIPIERMNALLVISPQAHIIEQARIWIERLDQGSNAEGSRLYVYHVQNGRADKIAPLLQIVFTGRAQQPLPTGPQLAPGLTPGQIRSPTQPPTSTTPAPVTPPPQPLSSALAAGQAGVAGVSRNVQIQADTDNNALLILASPAEYSIIESALKKLDISPRQVLIEAKIARVDLTDDFSLGLSWFLTNNTNWRAALGAIPRNTDGTLFTPANIVGRSPGFTYAWRSQQGESGAIARIFNMLATDSRTTILATPSLVATDNQEARIQVGRQVPILTSTQTSTTTTAGIIETVQYVDTGTILKVKPRINESGLITLDLDFELSRAEAVIPGGPRSPPINKTTAKSIVTVQSGETVIVGGLITEDKSKSTSGLPLLSQIPLVGALFGDQTFGDERTELVIFITPRLLSNDQQKREVLDELRKKMEYLEEVFPQRMQDKSETPNK